MTGETELLAKIDESMTLLEDIFGYTVEFHEDYVVAANVEKAMEQVHNLATILYHFLNDLGYEIMRSIPEETIYVLGADERIRELHNVRDYAFRGHVALPESTAEGSPDLKIVYLGSEIEAGAIGHEVAHEIDRRMGDYGTVSLAKEVGPIGSLLWYMKNEVVNRGVSHPKGHELQGYRFADAQGYLADGSRAASETEKGRSGKSLQISLRRKCWSPFEDFYSRGDTAVPIGFKKHTRAAAYIAIAMEQYFDHYDDFLSDGSPVPEAFQLYQLPRSSDDVWATGVASHAGSRRRKMSIIRCLILILIHVLPSLVTVKAQGIPTLWGNLDWSSDGRYIAVSTDRGVHVHHSDDLSLYQVLTDYDWPAIKWSNAGLRLAAATDEPGSITIWDLESEEETHLILAGKEHRGVFSIDWGPGDTRLIAGSDYDGIYMWETESGSPMGSVTFAQEYTKSAVLRCIGGRVALISCPVPLQTVLQFGITIPAF